MPKQRRQSNNIKPNGRSKYDDSQHLRIPHSVLGSPQFRSLNGNDVRVLMEICYRHNGYNNGHIGAGQKHLADTLMIGKSTAQRSLNRLQEMKFIRLRKKGMFQGRIASEWEVTFLKSEGYNPTNEWGQAKVLNQKRKRKPKTPREEILEEIEVQEKEKI